MEKVRVRSPGHPFAKSLQPLRVAFARHGVQDAVSFAHRPTILRSLLLTPTACTRYNPTVHGVSPRTFDGRLTHMRCLLGRAHFVAILVATLAIAAPAY